MNPAPAAAYLLRVSVRAPTLWSQSHARRRLTGRRTRTHNPLPAAIAIASKLPLVGGLVRKIPILGGIAGRFKKPSEARAAAVSQQLIEAANAGNLTAAKVINDRTMFGIEKERAVWRDAQNYVAPNLLQEARNSVAVADLGPIDHATPERAAAFALSHPVYGRYKGPVGVGTRGYNEALAAQQPTIVDQLGQLAAADRRRGGLTQNVNRSSRSRSRGGASRLLELSQQDPDTLTRAERKRLGLTLARVSRWNPDTMRAEKVWADSAAARSWPTVAQGKRSAKGRQQLERGVLGAAGGLARAAPAAGSAVLAAGSAAGLGAAATTAAVGAAFAVGYAIGTGINALIDYLSPEQRNERKALAFRQARADWAAAHGRPMTPQEVRDMGAGFKQATAEYRTQIGSRR